MRAGGAHGGAAGGVGGVVRRSLLETGDATKAAGGSGAPTGRERAGASVLTHPPRSRLEPGTAGKRIEDSPAASRAPRLPRSVNPRSSRPRSALGLVPDGARHGSPLVPPSASGDTAGAPPAARVKGGPNGRPGSPCRALTAGSPGLHSPSVQMHETRRRGADERGRTYGQTLQGLDTVKVRYEMCCSSGVHSIDRACLLRMPGADAATTRCRAARVGAGAIR